MFQVHHIALTAKDLKVTRDFYDAILNPFGYERHHTSDKVCSWVPPNGEENMPEFLIYASSDDQKKNEHKTYNPGAHHYCFRVGKKDLIDKVFKIATDMGAEILDIPTEYPNYAKNVESNNYYAVYFNDPNNIKLEFSWMPR